MWVKSQGVPIQQGDKISISVAYRTDVEKTITNIFPMHVRLIGEDSSIWDWNYDAADESVNEWVEKAPGDPIFDTNVRDLMTGLKTTDWKTVSGETKPFPVTGRLYIRLVIGNADYELYFNSLRINYFNFVNGSFTAYTGHQLSATQDFNTVAKISDEVKIADAPNRLIKGSILKDGISDSALSARFYDGQLYPSGPSDERQVNRFGWWQVFDVWNQYNRSIVKFDGKLDGTDSGNGLPSPTYGYYLLDKSSFTTDGLTFKMFILLHYNINVHLCEWSASLAEVEDTAIARTYEGFDFKYLEAEQ